MGSHEAHLYAVAVSEIVVDLLLLVVRNVPERLRGGIFCPQMVDLAVVEDDDDILGAVLKGDFCDLSGQFKMLGICLKDECLSGLDVDADLD